ncbi:hypothetical protein [Actinomyces ruminis]|uniref:Uncharacterized protein n=1 Tax=Actinomyces ruminis TaxID=1937003 RepID=A0ABX4MAY7_9ACTO|nr:hypothetical protein [Actinomyces ruminis]PHP52486.1 hypothetical protein BW737_008125 [Actinomyces ruminis]
MSPAPQTPLVFTAAGRHALGLVAREARADGVREILAPRVRCTAMAVPFELEGLHVTDVDCGPAGLLEPGALAAALAACNRPPLILHAEPSATGPTVNSAPLWPPPAAPGRASSPTSPTLRCRVPGSCLTTPAPQTAPTPTT